MRIFFLLTLLLTVSCSQRSAGIKHQLGNLGEEELQAHYTALLQRINQNMGNKAIGEIPAYAETCLKDSIFEYWYDTPWDFNGTTQRPRQGQIACGYFVTTTLKHLGLDIDRAYLAQQASAKIIEEVCDQPSVKIFTNLSYKKMKVYVQNYNGHIFIAGLDNHVGFIVKEKDEMYFVHASGISPYKVIKEKCDEAGLLVHSKYHMVGHINFSRWAKSLKKQGS